MKCIVLWMTLLVVATSTKHGRGSTPLTQCSIQSWSRQLQGEEFHICIFPDNNPQAWIEVFLIRREFNGDHCNHVVAYLYSTTSSN